MFGWTLLLQLRIVRLWKTVFSQWSSGESQEPRGLGTEFFLLYHCTCWLIFMLHYHPLQGHFTLLFPCSEPWGMSSGLPCSLDVGWIWPMVGVSQGVESRENRDEGVSSPSPLCSGHCLLALSGPLHNYCFCSPEQFSSCSWDPSLCTFRSKVLMAPIAVGSWLRFALLWILPVPLWKSLHWPI